MSAKKKIRLAVFLIIVIAIAFFWYVGSGDRANQRELDQKRYAEILKKDQQLKQLVQKAMLASTSTLKTLEPGDLPIKLKAKSVKTTSIQNTDTLRKYGLTIANILKPYGEIKESEAKIMLRALDKQSDLEAQKIVDSINLYNSTIEKLTKVVVPKDLVNLHLKMLNSLRGMSVTLTNMSNVLRNPLLALQSADHYRSKQTIFYNSINEINSYFSQHDVKFNEEEKIKISINFE